MSERLVVHCKKDQYDVYVGRKRDTDLHYGNPFSHKMLPHCIKVTDRREAVRAYELWLLGCWRELAQLLAMSVEEVQAIEPDRRRFILNSLKSLDGKVLGCWCAPAACHADVLTEYSRLSTRELTSFLADVIRSQRS